MLEGEQTEADKNIIEALADPLIHIVRNSLDHGLETPEVRRAAGSPETGTLTIRAAQQADRVVIEIIDDGKGIDPAVIKRKAYEKGLIDEAALERIDDREAVNLIFAAGLSTAEVISDLSGRGVGMDVVRSAVDKINGTVVIESELGKGTSIRISLPLSMAVTQVMIVESDGQLFGVPMENVVETVRVPRVHSSPSSRAMTAVLRGRMVPLNRSTAYWELPANLGRIPTMNCCPAGSSGGRFWVFSVDGFRETLGLIQKPLGGLSVRLVRVFRFGPDGRWFCTDDFEYPGDRLMPIEFKKNRASFEMLCAWKKPRRCSKVAKEAVRQSGSLRLHPSAYRQSSGADGGSGRALTVGRNSAELRAWLEAVPRNLLKNRRLYGQ